MSNNTTKYNLYRSDSTPIAEKGDIWFDTDNKVIWVNTEEGWEAYGHPATSLINKTMMFRMVGGNLQLLATVPGNGTFNESESTDPVTIDLLSNMPKASSTTDGFMTKAQFEKLNSLHQVLRIKIVAEQLPTTTDGYDVGDVYIYRTTDDNGNFISTEYVLVEDSIDGGTRHWEMLGPTRADSAPVWKEF